MRQTKFSESQTSAPLPLCAGNWEGSRKTTTRLTVCLPLRVSLVVLAIFPIVLVCVEDASGYITSSHGRVATENRRNSLRRQLLNLCPPKFVCYQFN